METGVDVNLPEVSNAPALQAAQEPLVVTVEKNGAISVGRSKVDNPAQLLPVLKQILQGSKDRAVFLQADRDVPYGQVVQVMAAIREAGIDKLGMVAQPPRP
jgi:biopolymer transport protein TolR